MRRAWVLIFGVGLVVPTVGCHKTVQRTAGVCDCYYPPVESLLVAPYPKASHPHVATVSGAYTHVPTPATPTPHVTLPTGPATPVVPGTTSPAVPATPMPGTPAPAAPAPKPAPRPTGAPEPLNVLPRTVE